MSTLKKIKNDSSLKLNNAISVKLNKEYIRQLNFSINCQHWSSC